MKENQKNIVHHNIEKLMLKNDWYLFKTEPNHFTTPEDFNLSDQQTYSTNVPSTVAMTINGTAPECWAPQYDYNDYDWWYCFDFSHLKNIQSFTSDFQTKLCFDGLATLCEIWLNNEIIVKTNNMFQRYEKILNKKINSNDKLFLVFRSISNELKIKRAKPKWKTKLVENQQMRWIRSTVLGHVAVWTPPIKAIGPWKEIFIESIKKVNINQLSIQPHVNNKIAAVNISVNLSSFDQNILWQEAEFIIDNTHYPLTISKSDNNQTLSLSKNIEFPDLNLWWPHTHGQANTYQYQLIIKSENNNLTISSGHLGFKSVDFTMNKSQSAFYINNEKVFCRGTCWTVSDYLSLNTKKIELEKLLKLMKDSGLNMIRIGGTMIYENDDFYELCDQLGILVWQDFMFASMDYPVEDPDFLKNITSEVQYQLNRLSRYACIALYCGNTDVEAQSAMYGIDKTHWINSFFTDTLPTNCKNIHPSIPYLPSSPTGGTLPFHLSKGVSHYWGIGAYMKPVTDQNKQLVKFCSEGMGLPHIPENYLIHQYIGKSTLYPYSNDWTSRIPRDLGAGWDFDTIRDFYLEDLFKVDARSLRRENVDLFMRLSKIITGEVISQVFQYWRSHHSQCHGGIVWFNRDFWPCAGFGIIDSNNQAKAAYYQLKQVWNNIQIIVTNQGLDGASITAINESESSFEGQIEVELIKDNCITIAKDKQVISLSKHQQQQFDVDAILGRFYDSGYAYRFGVAQFDILVCRLLDVENKVCSESFLFPESFMLPIVTSPKIDTSIKIIDELTIELSIKSEHFLQYVNIDIKNYISLDNYFHLSPSYEKTILLKKNNIDKKNIRGTIQAINLSAPIKIKVI